MKKFALLVAIFLCGNLSLPSQAQAQAEPFIGQIMWFGGNFCPRGWAAANGSLISISQNTALFSLLGTTYGGNGQTTFALPNLMGRVSVGSGQGAGLSNRSLGETGGSEAVTLSVNELPAHSHNLIGKAEPAANDSPSGAHLAGSQSYRHNGTGVALHSGSVGTTGGGQPHNNMPPFVTLTACIAMEGIYPSRN